MDESYEKKYEKKNGEALAETACHELLAYGLWNGRTKWKNRIKKYLLKQQTAPEDLVFWTTGILAEGLWQYRLNHLEDSPGHEETAARIDKALSAYYDRWMHKGCPVTYLDDLLAGEVLLSACGAYYGDASRGGIVNAQNIDVCRSAVDKLADYGMNYPTDEMGSFPYRSAQGNGYIFVDSIGLACPFLYRYGVMYDRADTVELAVKQIVNFLAYGMDGSTGLPYHGYVMNIACKYGIIGWGRAVGWLLRGMTGCMITEYGLERLKNSYIALVDTTLTYQRKDGYLLWQLQAADGPADTSATGMICVAIKRGMELGILTDEKYGQALQAGKNAIRKSVKDGRVYDCSGECEGFGQYPQRYGAYPWSLGPALMLIE